MVLLGLLVCVSLPGCSVCQNARRTLLDEPATFSWKTDRRQSVKVYRSWADQAWRQQCSAGCGQSASGGYQSRAYVAGFKDGFVDFVFAGGSGEPPPLPPRRYWNVGARNPRGHAGAADWFAGFRHGAQVARDEGYRDRAIVPASMFVLGPLEESHSDLPSFGQPFAPTAQPLPTTGRQPELVQPRLLQPPPNAAEPTPAEPDAAALDTRLPQAPKQQRSKSDLPTANPANSDFTEPNARGPQDPTPNNSGQATDSLPSPRAVPSRNVPPIAAPPAAEQPGQPQPPAPEPRPAEPDVDEIFDPLALDLSAYYGPSIRKVNHEQAETKPATKTGNKAGNNAGKTVPPAANGTAARKKPARRKPALRKTAAKPAQPRTRAPRQKRARQPSAKTAPASTDGRWRAATPPARQVVSDPFETGPLPQLARNSRRSAGQRPATPPESQPQARPITEHHSRRR